MISKISEDQKLLPEHSINFKKWMDKMIISGNDDHNDFLAAIRTKLKEKTTA